MYKKYTLTRVFAVQMLNDVRKFQHRHISLRRTLRWLGPELGEERAGISSKVRAINILYTSLTFLTFVSRYVHEPRFRSPGDRLHSSHCWTLRALLLGKGRVRKHPSLVILRERMYNFFLPSISVSTIFSHSLNSLAIWCIKSSRWTAQPNIRFSFELVQPPSIGGLEFP